MKRAFITGITGQDGSHLAELLLSKGYKVFGLVRRSSSANVARIVHLLEELTLIEGDLLDGDSLMRALEISAPDEIYNLGAQSFVPVSWHEATLTAEITGLGVLRLLGAMRKVCPHARFYQASSSEMFGQVLETPQRETTPFYPRSPYGSAKCFAHYTTVNFRESYGLHASCGILFNHEGPRRGPEFVTRKITLAAARIKAGLQETVTLGNLGARRDWGFAGDYVRAMWLMLQQDAPDDYVIGTGEMHSVREFAQLAFRRLGLDWTQHVLTAPDLRRPAEVDILLADPGKAKAILGWEPEVTFPDLVHMMVDADMCALTSRV
jgi:GDPmannose 4,6-dehydratase